MDASVSASVMWHGVETYPFTFSIKSYYIKVADATEYDRSLCNCTQMMQGGRQHQHHQHQHGQTSVQLPFFPHVEGEEGGGEREGRGGGVLGAGEVLLPPTMGKDDGVGDRIAMQ